MRFDFQKTIAGSQATLPIVGVIALGLWFLLPDQPPTHHAPESVFSSADYGLWRYVPTFLQEGRWSSGISALLAAIAVYLMAELNNSNVLLRVSSRMLGSTLALLLGLFVVCHRLQPGGVVMVFSLLSFFPFFATYQRPSPTFTFIIYLILSAASLVFPKLLLFVPAYWFIQGYLRAFSFRCFIASVLAVLLPYWFYCCIAFVTDTFPAFWTDILALADFRWYDYAHLNLHHILVFAFTVLLFATGTVDFYHHSFLDKTRTRILYNAVIMHGVFTILFIALQPSFFSTLFPVLLIDTSIVFGHFFTLTHTRFSHIYNLILLAFALTLLVLQFVRLQTGEISS